MVTTNSSEDNKTHYDFDAYALKIENKYIMLLFKSCSYMFRKTVKWTESWNGESIISVIEA